MKILFITLLCICAFGSVLSTCTGGQPQSPCASCDTGTNTNCKTCVAGYGLSGGTPAQDCTACTGDTLITNSAGTQCVASCGNGEVKNSDGKMCVTSCPTGQYKDTDMCKTCVSVMTGCAECSASNKCTKCSTGYLSTDMTKCGADCASGETKDEANKMCKKSFGYLKFVVGLASLLLVLLF